MNGAMKMMMISNQRKNDGQRSDGNRSGGNQPEGNRSGGNRDYGRSEYENIRNDYNGPDMNYGADSRYRGDGERNAYNEQVTGGYDDPENRRRYRRDDRGRFRSEGDKEMWDEVDVNAHYPMPGPYVPPVYEVQGNYPRMNKIGFSGGELDQEYRTYADHPQMNEMESRTSPAAMGHAKGRQMRLTQEMADEWMQGLQNEDGTRGPHWTMDHVKQIMSQRGIEADPIQFYAILNAIYSDYCKVLKKHGVGDRVDIYVDLACAWLNDKDAVKDKASSYYEHTVKH